MGIPITPMDTTGNQGLQSTPTAGTEETRSQAPREREDKAGLPVETGEEVTEAMATVRAVAATAETEAGRAQAGRVAPEGSPGERVAMEVVVDVSELVELEGPEGTTTLRMGVAGLGAEAGTRTGQALLVALAA